jgi:hypothetical protein
LTYSAEFLGIFAFHLDGDVDRLTVMHGHKGKQIILIILIRDSNRVVARWNINDLKGPPTIRAGSLPLTLNGVEIGRRNTGIGDGRSLLILYCALY